MSEEIVKVPDIGDAADVEVIEVCVSSGDKVEKDDTLIVLESDKASMEIPSPLSGIVGPIFVKVGSKVSQGDEILSLANENTEESAVLSEPLVEAVELPQKMERDEDLAEQKIENSNVKASVDVRVPDIGDASDVEVIEVAVKVGERVEKDATLIVLESDKASMEIPSPQAGVVKKISVNIGEKVSEGSLILVLETAQQPVEAPAVTNTNQQTVPENAPVTAQTKKPLAREVTIKVPDIGDAGDVEVIEIAIKVGDSVAVDDTLIVLESDKASMEIPSTQAGEVKAILLEVGQKVKQDTPIAVLAQVAETAVAESKEQDSKGEDTPPAVLANNAKKNSSPDSELTRIPEVAPKKSAELVYAGPAVRMLARELGVDLTQVKATGPRQRILKEDLQNFVKQALSERTQAPSAGLGAPTVPVVDFSQFGEISITPMTRIQKLTATAMHRSWLNVPHVTHFDEADITDLEEFRSTKKSQAAERGLKLTPLPFLIKACAAALKKYPQFNVSLAPSGEEIIQKRYINIGIAMDTPAGLMVPVIRNVDKKGVWELAEEATELGVKGQEGKLSREDLQGGCFTISSLGSIGGMGFTPIVNTPEVAILGVSKTSVKPVYVNSEFVPRKMLPLALSYDHRAINGVDAGQLMTFLTQVLADIRKLVL